MPSIAIKAGTDPETLIITGIDNVDSIMATFNPVNGYLQIAPQSVSDFTYNETVYPMQLITFVAPNTPSKEAVMSITRKLDGTLSVAPDSEAVGYLLAIELGYADGYYDLKFTPSESSRKIAVKNHVTAIKTEFVPQYIKEVSNIENTGEILKKGSVKIKPVLRLQPNI